MRGLATPSSFCTTVYTKCFVQKDQKGRFQTVLLNRFKSLSDLCNYIFGGFATIYFTGKDFPIYNYHCFWMLMMLLLVDTVRSKTLKPNRLILGGLVLV